MINSATTVLIYASFATALYFVVRYTTLARWWRNSVGRQMFAFGAVILGIATLGVLSQIFGQEYAARPWFRFAIWGGTAAAMFGFCVALERANRRKK